MHTVQDSYLLFIGTKATIRAAYQEWARINNKPFDESRLSIFERNYFQVKKYYESKGPGGLPESEIPRKLNEHAAVLREVFSGPALYLRRGDETQVHGATQLLDCIMAAGQKGISQMQRYKGLGEMNPDQLWETTLDRNARSLLQVRIKDVADADDLFVKLMGDSVEPRREFIQDNALNVANLDV